MTGGAHGNKTQEEPRTAQDERGQQATQEQLQVGGKDWENTIAERAGHSFFLRTDVLLYAMMVP